MPEASRDLFEIIATTRSMRRLKPDPVPAELIRKILEAGTSAPSGGNMQRWRFLVVTDPELKETVGAYYRRAWAENVYPRYSAGAPAPGTSPSVFDGCWTRLNISPIIFTRRRSGLCRAWREQPLPVRPD